MLEELKKYNRERKDAYRNGVYFEKNIEYERILSARYNKVSRIKKKIIYLMNRYNNIYFCTFTFDDYYINKCSRTQKDLIKKTLIMYDKNIKYILNVDYGDKNGRLHYHGIVATNRINDFRLFLKEYYPCFTSCDLVPTKLQDLNKVSKYINKLTNHTTKDSTSRKRIICNFVGYDNISTDSHINWCYYILEKNNLLS